MSPPAFNPDPLVDLAPGKSICEYENVGGPPAATPIHKTRPANIKQQVVRDMSFFLQHGFDIRTLLTPRSEAENCHHLQNFFMIRFVSWHHARVSTGHQR